MKFINYKDDKKIIKDIKPLYISAFPKDERAPLFHLKLKARKDTVNLYGIYNENVFVGFVYSVEYRDILYVYYFAVNESLRGGGYGSKILSFLKEDNKGKRIALNIEELDENAPNNAQRIKRKAFYEKNGFVDCNLKVKEWSVVLDVLSFGGGISEEEYFGIMQTLFWSFLVKKFVNIEKVGD